jgi:hypothetical protein
MAFGRSFGRMCRRSWPDATPEAPGDVVLSRDVAENGSGVAGGMLSRPMGGSCCGSGAGSRAFPDERRAVAPYVVEISFVRIGDGLNLITLRAEIG